MEGVCVARGWGAVRSGGAVDALRIGGVGATRQRPIPAQPSGTSAFAAGRRSSLTMRIAALLAPSPAANADVADPFHYSDRLLSSDSLIVTQMAAPFMIEAIDSERDGGVQFLDRTEGLMCEEVAFEIAPSAFDIVQFRGVFGQPLDRQPGAL